MRRFHVSKEVPTICPCMFHGMFGNGVVEDIDHVVDDIVIMHFRSTAERFLEKLSFTVIVPVIHQCENRGQLIYEQFHVFGCSEMALDVEVVSHDAASRNPDMVLHGHITENAEEYQIIGIGVKNQSAVYGDLKDMLEAFLVELSFRSHFSNSVKVDINVYHSELT
jgi:hypothetical protein